MIRLTKDNIGKVSVIIPFYNQMEFIKETIDSLVEQTYSNWEAIIVDDGSEDTLPSFTDTRVTVITQDHLGQSVARNRGLELAKGEYIQFLDSDDLLHKDKFAIQIATMEKQNADIAISGYWAFIHPDKNNGVSTDTMIYGNPFIEFRDRWENGLCVPIHCFLFKRHVLDECGHFDPTLSDHEDMDLHIRIAFRAFTYCFNDSRFALYRVHAKSRCRRMNTDGGLAVVRGRYLFDAPLPRVKYNLPDVTFIYCVRIDSEDRLRNTDFAMAFMSRYFNTNIIIIEDDTQSKIKGRYRNVVHIFKQNNSPVFYRTQLINEAVRHSGTKHFCNIDVDVFLDPKVYAEAYELLQNNSVVYPYNGLFYEIPQYYNKNMLLTMGDVDPKERAKPTIDSHGGCVFFNKKDFIDGGMENEHFVSWGAEDNERFVRFSTLGYSITRTTNPIYHFTHLRGVNSWLTNPYWEAGEIELRKVKSMNKDNLQQYIRDTFVWLKSQ